MNDEHTNKPSQDNRDKMPNEANEDSALLESPKQQKEPIETLTEKKEGGIENKQSEAPIQSKEVEKESVRQSVESTDEKSPHNRSSIVKALRTYKSDVAEAIKKQGASLVSIVTAENKRRVRREQESLIPKKEIWKPKKKKRKIAWKSIAVVVVSVVFLGAGANSAVFFYLESIQDGPIIKVFDIPSLVFVDAQEKFDVTGLSRREFLNQLNAKKIGVDTSLGSIKHFYIAHNILAEDGSEESILLNSDELFSLLDTQAPTPLIRSLVPTFMFGVHVFDGNQPFFILNTNFYENAFAGMLEWEAFMGDDLAPLFGPRFAPSTLSTQVGTTSATTTTDTLFPPPFEDLTIKNKDIRVSYNEDGGIKLLYGFPDAQTIIITTDEHTFDEILTRMRQTRVSR